MRLIGPKELQRLLADAWAAGYEAGNQDQSDAYWGPSHDDTQNPYLRDGA